MSEFGYWQVAVCLGGEILTVGVGRHKESKWAGDRLKNEGKLNCVSVELFRISDGGQG